MENSQNEQNVQQENLTQEQLQEMSKNPMFQLQVALQQLQIQDEHLRLISTYINEFAKAVKMEDFETWVNRIQATLKANPNAQPDIKLRTASGLITSVN